MNVAQKLSRFCMYLCGYGTPLLRDEMNTIKPVPT